MVEGRKPFRCRCRRRESCAAEVCMCERYQAQESRSKHFLCYANGERRGTEENSFSGTTTFALLLALACGLSMSRARWTSRDSHSINAKSLLISDVKGGCRKTLQLPEAQGLFDVENSLQKWIEIQWASRLWVIDALQPFCLIHFSVHLSDFSAAFHQVQKSQHLAMKREDKELQFSKALTFRVKGITLDTRDRPQRCEKSIKIYYVCSRCNSPEVGPCGIIRANLSPNTTSVQMKWNISITTRQRGKASGVK
jgi:hypothetical protein